jgi:maltodextrin utilization protein YvdJ
MLGEKKMKATLSFVIFILLLALLMLPVQVAFRQKGAEKIVGLF